MNRWQSGLTALVLTLGLQACAGSGDSGFLDSEARLLKETLEAMQVELGDEVDSVSNFRLNSWRSVNDSSLVVTSGIHDHFLLTLRTPCPALRYAFSIIIESRGMMLRPADTVRVNNLHARPAERCQVEAIYRLLDRE